MLIGYIRVSKSDGSQLLDLQKDALLQAGVDNTYIYNDLVSGRKDDRPGLNACLKALQPVLSQKIVCQDKIQFFA